jgi:hypothetical protein
MVKIEQEERSSSFRAAIKESNSFLLQKDNKSALRACRKASLYLPDPSDQFDYLCDLSELRNLQAKICITYKNPHYKTFLIHSLEAFALEIAKDLLLFPAMAPFYYKKKIQASPYVVNPDDNIDLSPEDTGWNLALKKLNLFRYRKAIIEEFNEFIYEDLPLIYGIPHKYNDEELLERISSTYKTKYKAYKDWLYLNYTVANKLSNKPLNYLTYEIHKFIKKLLEKYLIIKGRDAPDATDKR